MSAWESLGAPLVEDVHGTLRETARNLAMSRLEPLDEAVDAGDQDVEEASRKAVRTMGKEGLLDTIAPEGEDALGEVRSLVALREGLAYGSGLADAMFALQGLGAVPIHLAGSTEQKETWLPGAMRGEAILGFAMTEPEAGSDAASLQTRAERTGDEGWTLTGEKTLISNAGIADAYVLFARSEPEAGHRGVSAFLVPGDAPGLSFHRQEPIAAHPIGRVTLDDVRLEEGALLGEAGGGFRVALATLDRMRVTVAGAALGFAWRGLDETVEHARSREQFDRPLGAFQGLRWMIADASTRLDAARLLTYQAAWTKDAGQERVTEEAAKAKVFATETAQELADLAVQVHGGQGVLKGGIPERLYREVRALRIYEGASEVLRDVIGKSVIGDG